MRKTEDKLKVFEAIFYETNDRLYSFVKGILHDDSRVQDCLQQCYMKFWESMDNINTSDDVLPLLYTYSRNITIDHFRKNAKYVWVDDLSVYTEEAGHENSTEMYLTEKDNVQQVNQLLTVLPPKRREVFRLVKLQGLSYREAAEYLNISIHTVDKHMQEAFKALTTENLIRICIAFYFSNRYGG